MITTTTTPPPRCDHCDADLFGCQVKLGLGGRRCCDDCSHEEVRRDRAAG